MITKISKEQRLQNRLESKKRSITSKEENKALNRFYGIREDNRIDNNLKCDVFWEYDFKLTIDFENKIDNWLITPREGAYHYVYPNCIENIDKIKDMLKVGLKRKDYELQIDIRHDIISISNTDDYLPFDINYVDINNKSQMWIRHYSDYYNQLKPTPIKGL